MSKRLLNWEALAMLALIAMSAAWATRVGTLPGQGQPVLGPLVEGMLWASLYAGLSLTYSITGLVSQDSGRRVPRLIALCLLLALLSAHLCNLLSASLFTPWMWGKLFYLKRLLPPVLVVFWCSALLPRETRAVVRAAQANVTIAPLPQLTLLLASASVLVSCADLAFEWGGDSAVEAALKAQLITQEAWAGNVLLLFGAYALVFAVTCRVLSALLLVSPLYAAFGVATLTKIRYMHAAVQPLDVVRIGEFLPLARSFFGAGVLAAIVGALVLWIGALVAVRKTRPCPVSTVRRRATGLLSLVVLLGVPGAYFVEPAPWLWRDPADTRSPAKQLLVVVSRALLGQDRDREFRETAREAGVLRSFLSELPAAFVPTPAEYSPAAVASVASKYCRADMAIEPLQQPAARGRQGGVNLILYLVESLMDPAELGWHYTSDPMPNIRALREAHIGGYAIVPEEFGGSPTTEFEALSGMTTSFLPEGSVAYRLYLKQPIPSLPSTLKKLGYATTVVRADPKYFYNHEAAYRLLGFERVAWLDESPGVARGPRGSWPTDDAVVEAIIQAAEAARPFFVLAFASSAHSPYDHGAYGNSDLDVLDVPTKDAARDVKEYINAVRVADGVIGRLVQHFQAEPDSTIVVVLGDHLPPLRNGPLHRFFLRLAAMSAPEGAWMRRRVPLLIWANFDLPREWKELTTSALPAYLLEKMGVPSTGFLAVSAAVGRKVSIIRGSAKAADGTIWSWDSLPADERTLIADYRLLQYDVLLGERYSLSGGASDAGTCGNAAQSLRVSSP